MSRRVLWPLCVAVLLAACGGEPPEVPAVDVVRQGPITFELRAEGELKATRATPLRVPGDAWARRQLTWLLPDGARVEAGTVVARFSAADAELGLAQALLDLQRLALTRAAKEQALDVNVGRVDVDLAATEAQLAIAQRYAEADFEALARNVVLDAIQDERYLGEKRGVLTWQQSQSQQRGDAELQVLDAQRATLDGNAQRRRSDLDSLELVAPHDGLFVLDDDWSGQKVQIGAQLWAGNGFASLPDTASLEAVLSLPQLEAQGLREGLSVRLHPLGRPDQSVTSTLSWVASAPQTRNRQSPVKYLSMKAPVPAEAVRAHAWVPGQAFVARILLGPETDGLSVANLAIQQDEQGSFVEVLGADGPQRRAVTLGARGAARSQVLDGLAAGEQVLLAPAAAAPAVRGAAAGAGPRGPRGRGGPGGGA